MVSKMPKPVKLLRELLQEQQDPFSLQVYLMERSYIIRNNNQNEEEENNFIRTSRSSSFPQCSKVFRAVRNKLVPLSNQKQWRTIKGLFDCKDEKNMGKEVAEIDRMSIIASSSISLSNSFSDTDIEEISSSSLCRTKDNVLSASHRHHIRLKQNQDGNNENLQRMREESGKQLSPVSVLVEGLPLDEGQLDPQTTINSKIITTKEEEPNTTSKLRMNCTGNNDTTLPESYVYYLNSKRILQQRKQLLFDCVREAIAGHERKQRIRMQGSFLLPTFLGPDELGRLISEKITEWGKQSIDETSIGEILKFDLLDDSVKEWSCEVGTTSVGEVAKEIGDAIFVELVHEIFSGLK